MFLIKKITLLIPFCIICHTPAQCSEESNATHQWPLYKFITGLSVTALGIGGFLYGGKVALHKAIENNSLFWTEALACFRLWNNTADSRGRLPLAKAVANNAFGITYVLLINRADPNQQDNSSKLYPLELAIEHNNVNMVALLTNYRADRQRTNSAAHITPLIRACLYGYNNIASQLIKPDIDWNITNNVDTNGWHALHHCALKGNTELCTLIIEQNTYLIDMQTKDYTITAHGEDNLDTQDPKRASTALHIALSRRHFELARVLLRYGPNCRLRDSNNWTALHSALEADAPADIIKTILENVGMRDIINEQDKNGNTVLHDVCIPRCYALKNLPTFIALLIGHGANPFNQNKHGATPLHLLVQYDCTVEAFKAVIHATYAGNSPSVEGNDRVAKLLTIKDQYGNTAWNICKNSSIQNEIEKLLISRQQSASRQLPPNSHPLPVNKPCIIM